MMKNPAPGILAIVGGVGVLAGLVLVLASVYGAGRTYDVASGEMGGGVPIWVGIIPLTIGVLAVVAALVLWGMRTTDRSS